MVLLFHTKHSQLLVVAPWQCLTGRSAFVQPSAELCWLWEAQNMPKTGLWKGSVLQCYALPLSTQLAVALPTASLLLLLQGASRDEDGQVKLLSTYFASSWFVR